MQKQPYQEQQAAVNLWVVLMKVWAVTLYLPLRKRMGRDHVGICLLFACFLIYVVSSYAKAPDLMLLFVIDVIAWVVHRIAQIVRYRRGVREHSEYSGDSWLFSWVVDDDTAKKVCEPLLCFFIGWVIYRFTSQPNAATYFWYGGVILFAVQMQGRVQNRRVETLMTNAMLEHEWYSKQMRRRF